VKPSVLYSVTLALLMAAAGHAGQGPPATAREFYEEALARDQALRAVMNTSGAPLRDFRAVVSAYDTVVRKFPTSGYVDNALWQGAGIARDAFERFGEDADRATAKRMLALLVSDYPASPFVARAREILNRLDQRPATNEKASPQPLVRPVPRRPSVLRSVTRTSLPDRVQVTIELDAPTIYRTERVENPPRVLFDLTETRLGESVSEGTLSYTDTAVRRVRVGIQPNQVARVVLELGGVARYAVSTLEHPYRIVVVCDRAAAPAQPVGAAAQPVVRTGNPPLLPAHSLPGPWGLLPACESPETEWLRVQTVEPQTAPSDSPNLGIAAPKTRSPAPPPSPPPVPPPGRGPVSLARQLGLGASKIVIDPGHGGHDPGALGPGVSESEIVLDIALRLESLLTAAGVDVVLTRRTDEFVPLDKRPAVATREQADLFLSIHVNASRVRSARGIESYFLNFATDPGAEAVAARENAATTHTMNNLPDIVKAIALNNKLNESRSFAALIQRTLAAQLYGANNSERDHGVKQAPFVVLIGADMPSVLVEVAFISNPQEGRLLQTGAYRQRIAQALFDATRGYQRSLKSAAVFPLR
jgi:N-acetylmuramoyl-L-alanine amidase